jgi:coenzyme F420-0:L-glutamate ligase/coenzyme F420-1:gamma-L-glutamate ligase
VITIFAPTGIGEIVPGTDLAAVLLDAVGAHPEGPLRDGDIVVVTSKIISKAENRSAAASDREQVVGAETQRTVAARGQTRIVRTHSGLTVAAAGVDNSNVAAGSILRLPGDPDGTARRLRDDLAIRAGVRAGVLISDTAGRPWRLGQTDHAIGADGVRVIERYAGAEDPYGNPLHITAMAVADELAAAADLVKGKLNRRPVAVIRGLHRLVIDGSEPAAELVRPAEEDLFGHGSREAVLAAALQATGQSERYEELVVLSEPELVTAVMAGSGLTGAAADLLTRLLRAAYGEPSRPGAIDRRPHQPS